MSGEFESDGPDLFGAHEKFSEQSIELARWVVPAFLILPGLMGVSAFGLSFPEEQSPVLGIIGWCCMAWVAGVVLYTASGGPMRIEVDQSRKTVKWMHARRLRPQEKSWHFDEIEQFSRSLMSKHFRNYMDDSGLSTSKQTDFETYYLCMTLKDGSRQLLFGKNFKLSNRSTQCDVWMKKMVQLTGRPEQSPPTQAETDAMAARVNAALAARRK